MRLRRCSTLIKKISGDRNEPVWMLKNTATTETHKCQAAIIAILAQLFHTEADQDNRCQLITNRAMSEASETAIESGQAV